MKRLIYFFLPLALALSCQVAEGPEGLEGRFPDAGVQHGMIRLGEKLDDPYTVENMQKALTKLYPTKADRIDISATDLYVRFLPKTDAEYRRLEENGLYLMDHPMDYSILQEGDYYQDPEVGDEAITWQYAVVPHDYVFPEGIRCEKLDDVFISEHAPATRAADGIDWARVEEEAFRLTGNAGLWEGPSTKAESVAPSGRITIEDPLFSGGKPFGVAGVKVAANIFVKIATTYTDRDGYYQMDKTFSGNPRYRLVFNNIKGFNLGLNLLLVTASVSTLGKGGPEGMDLNVTQEDSSGALFRRCVVNNAAYDYYDRCTQEDLDILPPPTDLRIWIFPGLTASSACMLHHGALLDNDLLQKYLSPYLAVIQLFLPDLTIGTREMTYDQIYGATVHELAHASHYRQVQNAYWTPFIEYVIRSYITEGQNPYGSGTAKDAGYCEVGEMWGYFMQESLKKDRYGGTIRQFGNSFWFQPDIFTYLYERGISRGDLFRALKTGVTSTDALRQKLIEVLPDKASVINQTFQHYGK